ncbi:MAG: hypothetical protein SH817_03830 [Leptospira sp.]|nr:hypothetical protein [Leptospira sp.]
MSGKVLPSSPGGPFGPYRYVYTMTQGKALSECQSREGIILDATHLNYLQISWLRTD